MNKEARFLFENMVRWSTNQFVEVLSNYGRTMPEDVRVAFKNVVTSLASLRDVLAILPELPKKSTAAPK